MQITFQRCLGGEVLNLEEVDLSKRKYSHSVGPVSDLLNVTQGSQLWKDARIKLLNGSKIATMLGKFRVENFGSYKCFE